MLVLVLGSEDLVLILVLVLCSSSPDSGSCSREQETHRGREKPCSSSGSSAGSSYRPTVFPEVTGAHNIFMFHKVKQLFWNGSCILCPVAILGHLRFILLISALYLPYL